MNQSTQLGVSARPTGQVGCSAYCHHCITHTDCVLADLPQHSPVTGFPLVRERHFQRGDVLRHEGGRPDVVQMIKVGNVVASRTGVDGVARPVAIWGRGQVMGRPSLLQGGNALSCQAVSTGRVCEVMLHEVGTSVFELLQDRLVQRYAQALADLADWSHLMRIKGLLGQVAGVLLHLGRTQRTSQVQVPSHGVLAAVLGASREAVARVLTQLEQRGALQRLGRSHVQIDAAQLMQEISGALPLPVAV